MPGSVRSRTTVDEILGRIESGDHAGAASAFQRADLDPDATRSLFGQLAQEAAAAFLAALTDDAKAREILLWLPTEQAALIVPELEPAAAARLIAGLHSDERADLLAALPTDARGAILADFPSEAWAETARLLQYPAESAGGLMETEFLAYPTRATVGEAIRDIRANQEKYALIGVQYVYLLGDARKLVGVAPVRDLLLAPETAPLASLVRAEPTTVREDADTHAVAAAFDEHPFMALPVVDERGMMLGVVTRAQLTESRQEEAEDDYRVSQGIVGGEELRSMPIALRLRRRSAWLGVNLLLSLGGAAIVALYQDTLAKAIVVAAVLPVISATSGNAAMQAAAVSIRELALGVIDQTAWRRVLVHEFSLAALLAVPLGCAVAALARVWGAGWSIGVAVGVAMALNSLVAIVVGATCPLILRRVRIDPALASGPISTTLADVSGFALTLTLVASSAP